jgi:hypothetical protein
MALKDFAIRRSRAYKGLFLDEHGRPTRNAEIVLAHLRRVCQPHKTSIVVSPVTGIADPMRSGEREGMRAVWNIIQGYLNMDEAEIAKLKESSQTERDEYGE